jgi:hypothetical protein
MPSYHISNRPSHGCFWGRKRGSYMGKIRRNVGSLWRYRRCGIASGRPMFSVVVRHIKRLPSGVLSPLVIDQTQGVRVELNACFVLRLATVNCIRDTLSPVLGRNNKGWKMSSNVEYWITYSESQLMINAFKNLQNILDLSIYFALWAILRCCQHLEYTESNDRMMCEWWRRWIPKEAVTYGNVYY